MFIPCDGSFRKTADSIGVKMNKDAPGVAIIGCGLIGQKRAKGLGCARLMACADVSLDRAQGLAKTTPGATATSDWKTIVSHSDVDLVIVATTNNLLSEISCAAAREGKHVLVEKPGGRNIKELEAIETAAQKTGVLVRVGFNHRYHSAIRKARELYEAGGLGELMFIRGRYGHGGRVGYEREWRANPMLSGGGELIDQGIHLIDLARWFLGDFAKVEGFAHTYFWNMPVDDNGFMLLRTADQKAAFLHVSCTEWKNLFSLEIYGQKAKIHIEGLGGSYGLERLSYYKMLPEMGPPDTTIWEFPRGDDSWTQEFAEFLEDIRLDRKPSAGLSEAKAALRIVETIYKNSGLSFFDKER
jgi:predicted dehydrogenase